MKKQILTGFILIFSLSFVKAQHKINKALKHELDSMYVLDQKYRILVSEKLDSAKTDSLSKIYNVSKDQLVQHLWKLQTDADSSNVKRIEEIIAKFGYPGRSLVDTPTNEAAFFVLQHSTVIDKYLPLIEKAAKDKELPFHLYAMMKDRSLMYNKKEQIWGTQAKGMTIINKKTGKAEFKFFIWPIADPEHVNERRKQAGFTQTVEENAKRMGLTYKVYTLQQVQNNEIE
ncbi:DUF6624 domain-containing protein [Mucilaginibacter litoreus]|uniref:DUF6624 domain-containing protein n=1 Tax=Mucilaginibacter litoreus TaxID=1048221 RepID=A0ABW3AUL5_9SPHI